MNTLDSYLQDDENKEQIKNNSLSLPRQSSCAFWKDYGGKLPLSAISYWTFSHGSSCVFCRTCDGDHWGDTSSARKREHCYLSDKEMKLLGRDIEDFRWKGPAPII